MMKAAKAGASSLEAHLGYWLRFVSNHVSERFKRLLAAEGISVTEWVALRTLFDHTQTTHTELIRRLRMTKGAASKVMTKLEQKGLAHRRLADGCLREQVLGLTARGRTLVPHLAALADRNDAHFFAHLDRREREALMTTLRELVAHHELREIPVS